MSATTGLVLGTLGLVGLGASYYLYQMSSEENKRNYDTDNIPLFHDPDVKELPTDPVLNEEITLGGRTMRRRKILEPKVELKPEPSTTFLVNSYARPN